MFFSGEDVESNLGLVVANENSNALRVVDNVSGEALSPNAGAAVLINDVRIMVVVIEGAKIATNVKWPPDENQSFYDRPTPDSFRGMES